MVYLFHPYLLLFLGLVCLVLLACRKWVAAGVFGVAFVVLNCLTQSFGFRPFHFRSRKARGTISVLAYNIHGSGEDYDAQALCRVIGQIRPDMLFLSEYSASDKVLLEFVDSLYGGNADVCGEQLVASRFEMTELGTVPFSHFTRLTLPGGDGAGDGAGDGSGDGVGDGVGGGGLPLVVVTCHLPSNNYQDRLYFTPDSIQDMGGLRRYLRNIDRVAVDRLEAARTIGDSIPKSVPCIVMGDMNDVSGSPALDAFAAAGLEDAWWRGGLGFGPTIFNPVPFRIDHIMYSPSDLRLVRVRRIKSRGLGLHGNRLSDHDGLVAFFEYHWGQVI